MCIAVASPALAAWPSLGVGVCADTNYQSNPTITSDGQGGAIIAWEDYGSAPDRIYAQRVDANGNRLWGANGVQVCPTALSQYSPFAVSDGEGGAMVFWVDGRSGGSIYVQRLDPNGAPLFAIAGLALCTVPGAKSAIDAISDGGAEHVPHTSGFNIAWQEVRATYSNLYLQHVDIHGGHLWTPANGGGIRIDPFYPNDDMASPRQVIDGFDPRGAPQGSFIAWQEAYRPPFGTPTTESRVARVDATGTLQWSEGVGYGAGLAPAEPGHAIMAFETAYPSPPELMAQKLGNTGSALWTPGGVRVDSGDVAPQGIVGDGAGGAIVLWSLFNGPARAQRLDANGTTLWTPGGLPLASGSAAQLVSASTFDGAGGAIVAFEDNSGVFHAQRIDTNGALQWGNDGFSFTPVNASTPVLTWTATGKSIAAWSDQRSAKWKVYAQSLEAADVLGVASAATPGMRFVVASANPAPEGRVWLDLDLERDAMVTVDIVDAAGRRVRTLARGEPLTAGRHAFEWDGDDATGSRVSPGLYFARSRSGAELHTSKIIELR